MIRIAAILAFLPLTACAISSAQLGRDEVDLTLTSAKAPDIVAGCISTSLIGSNPIVRLAEGHYVVTRVNGYNIPVIRYDVFATATGSTVELRTSVPVGAGADKARACL